MKNINLIDQFFRLVLGMVSMELAVFWLAGLWQFAAYAAGALLILTALIRFCPLYRIAGVSTCGVGVQSWGIGIKTAGAILLLAVLAGGSYTSMVLTRKAFMEEFNAMNHLYKQTLFLTAKNEREKSIANYDQLLPAYKVFQEKYTRYRPMAFVGDQQLALDLSSVALMLTSVDALIRTGDLLQAHLALEHVRPVFQDIFKRNGISLLSVSLVDFHDAMELVIDAANSQDALKVIALYPQVSDKLKAVEEQANDTEIQAIRKNLDEVLAKANSTAHDKMPSAAEALKSSFIKVYLKRG